MNSYYYSGSSSAGVGAAIAAFSVILVIFGIIGIVAGVLLLIGLYKMFKKAGRNGYEGLIPLHNTFVMFEIAGINPIWILGIVFGSVVSIIPVLGSLAFAAYTIFVGVWLNTRLARAFGKTTGFGVLMFFFPYVMYPVLGFGNAQYVGFNKVENKPGEDKPQTPQPQAPVQNQPNPEPKAEETVEPKVEEKVEEKKEEEKK